MLNSKVELNDKKLKYVFIFKMITKYFLFGYLCFFGFIFTVYFAYFIYCKLPFPANFVALFFIILSIPLLAQFLRILFSSHYKYRYYKISVYRLKTRGYKDSYFECEMHEPCFRLIIRDLLFANGYSNQYFTLKQKCNGKNFRVERAKEKLLAKVIRAKTVN